MEMGGNGILLFFIFIFPVLLLSYNFLSKKKRDSIQAARLPPGSLGGWPLLGHSSQLYSQDPNVFFSENERRYGDVFKSLVLGCPCAMLTSPEAARMVLLTKADLFKPNHPECKERLIGPSALFYQQGDLHSRLRKLVQQSLSREVLQKLIPNIEAIAISLLDSWSGGHIVNTYDEMKKFSFGVGILLTFSCLDSYYSEELRRNYSIVNEGYNSHPSKKPGTPYMNAVMARDRLGQVLSEIIYHRKEQRLEEKNLLGCLMNSEDEKGQLLTDNNISDNIIGVLFAAQDTTASVLTWILKYLHDDRGLLEAVINEQKAIYEQNDKGRRHLTWAQTKDMKFTNKVISETLRMASVVSFTFREAVADVEYNGNLIPKGWKVMPLFRSIHHNPKFFPNPQKFDPSRFEVAPKPNTFLPFGLGAHACPGNELAKLEMLIMVHHLVTKYRWGVVNSESGTEYGPFPIPRHGLPARFWKESSSSSSGENSSIASTAYTHQPHRGKERCPFLC